ncbi:hypothetical protein NEIFLAOT_00106 [Neisseria flavescens NRL30031/H210]|uniref:Uncharacterized protein n=1 Tax=Neisseria flavescens NRL30031/H210 TaxID=546264 RepID=C0EJL8_NEIFL|nr:hypothetical protein NEIFLAOT_00106 [Neisseria flavescens NRL30031/H210]
MLLESVNRLLRTLRHCVAATEALFMLSIFYKRHRPSEHFRRPQCLEFQI